MAVVSFLLAAVLEDEDVGDLRARAEDWVDYGVASSCSSPDPSLEDPDGYWIEILSASGLARMAAPA